MTIALVVDADRGVGVLQVCPVGTHFWSIEQAERLASDTRTGIVMREAALQGKALQHGATETQPRTSRVATQDVELPQVASHRAHRQAVVSKNKPVYSP